MATQFVDRRDTGQRLAAELKALALPDPVVLALPRGGVPVGYEVAVALNAPLDVLLVRKLGAPGYEEFGIGAVVDGAQPQIVLNAEAISALGVTASYIEAERDRQLAEIERRRRLYSGSAPALSVQGHTAIVVDDGVATGGTLLAALHAIKHASPRCTVLAVPVAPPDTLQKLAAQVDEVVCLSTPRDFRAVGMYYEDFEQTSDEEVIDLLRKQGTKMRAERHSAAS